MLQADRRCNCKEGQTQSFAFLPLLFLDSVPWLLRTLLYSSLCDNVYYSCRCLLLGKKCLVGVGILGICIPILRQSTSVQDELKGEKVPLHRFRSWLCLMMVCNLIPDLLSHCWFNFAIVVIHWLRLMSYLVRYYASHSWSYWIYYRGADIYWQATPQQTGKFF